MNSKFNDDEIKKYLKNLNDPNSKFEKLKTYTNAANKPLFETDYHETYKVNIKPDSSIAPGKFLPNALIPNEYRAHPTTIRAMKKDIFMGGDDFVDLECLYQCSQCKNELDLQFWHFCPFCEAPFNI